MIQDISPKKLNIEYQEQKADKKDLCFVFKGNQVLVRRAEQLAFLTYGDLAGHAETCTYLFGIDDEKYFLVSLKDNTVPEGCEYQNVRAHRHEKPKYTVFAEITAYHLYLWYRDNQFCGRCGSPTVSVQNMRALKCPHCGNLIFPKIAPAVIVGVTNGDKLLMTKYNGREYTGYSLIAGFVEIGESAEDTVKREVMEEVGLRVKSIRYRGNQPWGIDSNLLLGFFADVDGDDTITMDTEELSLAAWYRRDEIEMKPDGVSLTNKLIQDFLNKKI